MNREEWLTKVAEKYIRPLFAEHNAVWPEKYRVSVGFPKGSRGGKHAIGQCWSPTLSADKSVEMFISPELPALEAVDTLVHEMVHASVGVKCGHKGAFKKLALAVGLVGKMTSAGAGEALIATIKKWLAAMPEFPGAPLIPGARADGAKKPGSRLLKCMCADCGFTFRTTQLWIDEVGLPTCACGGAFEQS